MKSFGDMNEEEQLAVIDEHTLLLYQAFASKHPTANAETLSILLSTLIWMLASTCRIYGVDITTILLKVSLAYRSSSGIDLERLPEVEGPTA